MVIRTNILSWLQIGMWCGCPGRRTLPPDQWWPYLFSFCLSTESVSVRKVWTLIPSAWWSLQNLRSSLGWSTIWSHILDKSLVCDELPGIAFKFKLASTSTKMYLKLWGNYLEWVWPYLKVFCFPIASSRLPNTSKSALKISTLWWS